MAQTNSVASDDRKVISWKVWLFWGLLVLLLGLLGWLVYLYRPQVQAYMDLVLKKPKDVKEYVLSWGPWAPFVFTSLQALQVVFAPVPGEATGFLGGFIFGFLPGFLYSSVGLTVGSLINLGIGRYVGRGLVERVLPASVLARFDHLLRAKAVFVIFILFLIPGFPKDYLCLVLGMSRLPLRLLLIVAAVGRIPGTLILSLQGASLEAGRYLQIIIVSALALAFLGPAYLLRDRIYQWSERWEKSHSSK
ncbi:MAG: TVP38/TMEM64 family protein [Deltaproteobacteria bacterium]|nr:TVP38/TMEM64 family protein [Deltaproteobacteria bacterium]